MIVRTGGFARRVPRAVFGGVRAGFPGARPYGIWGARRGVWGGYRPGLRAYYGARLRPWVHRPIYGSGYRTWSRGVFRGGLPFARPAYYGRLAPWVRGGYGYRPGVPWLPYWRRRPWIYRNALPAWLWRYFPALAPAVDAAPVVPPAPLMVPTAPEPEPVAPPADTAPAADAAPPDAAGPAPADAPPEAAASGAAPGGDAPPAEGAAPAGDAGSPPTGELPDLVAADGRQVRIRWDHRARPLADTAPPGGGVYVVFRNGRPAAIHVTSDFRRDIARRFPDAASDRDDVHDGDGEGEQFWGRPYGRGRRFRRFRRFGRRRWARFGRLGGFGRFGRFGRIALLRSLRQQMPTQDTGDDDDDAQSDDSPEGM